MRLNYGSVLCHISAIKCPCSGAGAKGKWTGEAGFVAYYEICNYIKSGYTVKYHPEHKAMYAYSTKEHNWVGYDDPKTLAIKLDYLKAKGREKRQWNKRSGTPQVHHHHHHQKE